MKDLLKLQSRVIGALVLREVRATFGTSRLGYLWAILTPTAGVIVLVVVFSTFIKHPPYGSSFALFYATGYLILEFFNKLSASLMTVFSANKALLTYPLIKTTDTLFARFLLICATYILIMVAFFGVLILVEEASVPCHVDQLLFAFLSMALFGVGCGLLNALIYARWESWGHVQSVINRPLIFISGIFYMPRQLPSEALEILQWNPILHAVEWFRVGYYQNYDSMVLNRPYLIGVSLVLLVIGLAGERLFRKQRTGG
jgi:capsular polysaccharide transport system permease protein